MHTYRHTYVNAHMHAYMHVCVHMYAKVGEGAYMYVCRDVSYYYCYYYYMHKNMYTCVKVYNVCFCAYVYTHKVVL